MRALALNTADDGRSQIQLRVDRQTVWLTQLEIGELFDANRQNISLHLKEDCENGGLDVSATVKDSLIVRIEGLRETWHPVKLYNFNAIVGVGYRVRSPRGVQFPRCASTLLKEYLLKGFVMDNEQLNNPDDRPEHFDDMPACNRDIPASEKRFYQKVRDLFALSTDYDKSDRSSQQVFAAAQSQDAMQADQTDEAEPRSIKAKLSSRAKK